MRITYAAFTDLIVKIDRPVEISNHDKMICIRAYEKLKGINEDDAWTKEADKLFKDHNIKVSVAQKEEFDAFVKKANSITARL